jgi:hypothetical protein
LRQLRRIRRPCGSVVFDAQQKCKLRFSRGIAAWRETLALASPFLVTKTLLIEAKIRAIPRNQALPAYLAKAGVAIWRPALTKNVTFGQSLAICGTQGTVSRPKYDRRFLKKINKNSILAIFS